MNNIVYLESIINIEDNLESPIFGLDNIESIIKEN